MLQPLLPSASRAPRPGALGRLAVLAAALTLAACGNSRAPLAITEPATTPVPPVQMPAPDPSPVVTVKEAPLLREDRGSSVCWTGGPEASSSVVCVQKNPWRLSWLKADGTLIVQQSNPSLPDPTLNPDFLLNDNRSNGIDSAYPGLQDISYQPFAYRSSEGWSAVSTYTSDVVEGQATTIETLTADGKGAIVHLHFGADGALEIAFAPKRTADEIQAVEAAFASPATEHYFGAGQRFSAFDLRGTSVPLWISHGPQSNRTTSTNEIASSFFWSPSGWGLWGESDARGELNVASAAERADAINLMQEDSTLKLVLYRGTPQQMLSTHTARMGRPAWIPPDWMWAPAVWQDSDTTTATVQALVAGMKSRDIPLGAVWLDNPWDAGRASFNFDAARFASPDALLKELHDEGLHVVVWVSPFAGGAQFDEAKAKNWLVTGTREDNQDATYYDISNGPDFGRGIDPHVDFTNPVATLWWKNRLRALIRRGVDGVKVDRGEEDLSDTSVWANGLPNALNHNAYIGRYHQAIFEAFEAERPNHDFSILSRGGWNGSTRYSGHWAADNTSAAGELGLTQALRSLLSLSASGFFFNGADIGGYAGLRQDMGEAAFGNPILPPTPNTYIRWTQLGALSPVMQTPIPPWWVDDESIRIYKRFATLHSRLVPYIAAAAKQAVELGVPIVRAMPYAFPDDAVAVMNSDQYLLGPDLLVAPVHGSEADAGSVPHTVYLPAGDWTDFWSGTQYSGPTVVPLVVATDEMPLFVRTGAKLPPGVSASELP